MSLSLSLSVSLSMSLYLSLSLYPQSLPIVFLLHVNSTQTLLGDELVGYPFKNLATSITHRFFISDDILFLWFQCHRTVGFNSYVNHMASRHFHSTLNSCSTYWRMIAICRLKSVNQIPEFTEKQIQSDAGLFNCDKYIMCDNRCCSCCRCCGCCCYFNCYLLFFYMLLFVSSSSS